VKSGNSVVEGLGFLEETRRVAGGPESGELAYALSGIYVFNSPGR
jgi:hypothetical protein